MKLLLSEELHKMELNNSLLYNTSQSIYQIWINYESLQRISYPNNDMEAFPFYLCPTVSKALSLEMEDLQMHLALESEQCLQVEVLLWLGHVVGSWLVFCYWISIGEIQVPVDGRSHLWKTRLKSSYASPPGKTCHCLQLWGHICISPGVCVPRLLPRLGHQWSWAVLWDCEPLP
jgi:hypothetical protein